MAPPRISIVIPVFNLAHTLPLTLRCIEAQSYDHAEFECIFVDDCSTDDSAALIDGWRTAVSFSLVRNERNKGRSVTRNRGLREARGDLVVFLDGDMFVSPFWLATYARRFGDGDVDVLSGRRWSLNLTPEDGDAREALRHASIAIGHADPVETFHSLRERSTLGQGPSVVKGRLEQEIEEVCSAFPTALTRALAFITSNVAVARTTLQRTGGFSPWFERGEDTELGLRLARSGARFAYLPEAEAVHPFTIDGEAGGAAAGMLGAMLFRHPYAVVLLWYVWASSVVAEQELRATAEPAEWSSLVDIAKAEASGGCSSVDAEAILRGGSFGPSPFRFELGRHDLVTHLSHWCGASEGWLGDLLDTAVREGMLVGRRGPEILFDLTVARNWLEQHTGLRQYMFAHSFARTHKTECQRTPGADAALVSWNGRYDVQIPSDALPLDCSEVGVILPLPTASRLQFDLQFGECWPHDLLAHARNDLIFSFPLLGLPEKDGMRRAGYSFRCVVREWTRQRARQSDQLTDMTPWLRPDFPAAQLRRCQALLADLAQHKDHAPEERAHGLYNWMLQNTSYALNDLPDHAASTTGCGHCVQLVRLFVNLCRLSGIPARESCGALAGRLMAETAGTTLVTGYFSPFAHTWAEVWIGAAGWIPVELIGVEHSARVATACTFPDAELRAAFSADARCYASYYFGQLDPYRIHSTFWANQLPTLVRQVEGRWVGIPDRRLRIRHQLTLSQ